MLLIDARSGRVASVDPLHLRVPAVTQGPWRGPDDAYAWLRRLKVDPANLVRVLARELERQSLLHPSGGASAAAVMQASARALAAAKITAGARIEPATMTIRFDDTAPEADLRHEAWVRCCGWLDFPTAGAAEAFATELVENPGNAAQVGRALDHESSRPWRSYAAVPGGRGELAGLLRSGVLGLRPEDNDLNSWRIAWPSRRAAGAPMDVDYGAPSGRSAPGAPPPAPKGPVSSLPDPSESFDSLLPQVQALIAAAQSGAPFCEECARLAASKTEAAA